MQLKVFKETPARLPTGRLRRLFDTVVKREGRSGWQATVNLVITDDRRIRTLNHRFRLLNRPTDVLSFNIDPPQHADAVFGEIYISAPTVRRQAQHMGHGLWEEYLLLFCHGLLHLFGHDHASKADERVMFNREKRYLDRLAGKK